MAVIYLVIYSPLLDFRLFCKKIKNVLTCYFFLWLS